MEYRNGIAEKKIFIYYRNPKEYTKNKDIIEADKRILRNIQELKQTITQLNEYRNELSERYNELYQMRATISATLRREKRWRDPHVTYSITTEKKFEDGTSDTVEVLTYSGTERRQALAKFQEIKKKYPNYEFVEDIEKKSWER